MPVRRHACAHVTAVIGKEGVGADDSDRGKDTPAWATVADECDREAGRFTPALADGSGPRLDLRSRAWCIRIGCPVAPARTQQPLVAPYLSSSHNRGACPFDRSSSLQQNESRLTGGGLAARTKRCQERREPPTRRSRQEAQLSPRERSGSPRRRRERPGRAVQTA
jgi:hypothetical protein